MKSNEKNKKSYYAVTSKRGLAVYSDYSKVVQAEPFIGKCRIEEYSSRNKAEKAAIDNYNRTIAGTRHKIWPFPDIPRTSWFYFSSKIDSGTILG